MSQIKEQSADYQLTDLAPVLKAADADNILLESLPVWLSAQTRKSAGRGRSADNTLQYGVQKLRELILELAVRGKLVPQDTNDEPASILLKKIAEEKATLIKSGLIKKSKKISKVEVFEHPYTIPENWSWTRLDNVTPYSINDGDWIESKDQDTEGNIRLIQLADIGVDEFKDVSRKYVNSETFKRLNCFEVKKGDVLIARLPSPIGRACIFPGLSQTAITAVDVAILRPDALCCSEYIVHAINSPIFRKQVESFGKGATRFRISTGNLKTVLLPLPPFAEQNRIVRKVDELMLLCDQLEQQQTDAVQAHDTLIKVLLDTLTQSENAEDFQQNWHRIAEHFDTLFNTESSIDQLKQTLLQLAVMGKLVPQDPNDESASILIEKIAEEKSRLVKEGKIKKQKPQAAISEDEKPYLLPTGWVWTCLGSICQINPRNEAADQTIVSFVPMSLVTTSHNGEHDQETRTWKEVKSGFTHFADGDVAVAKITPCFENGKAVFFQNLKNGLGAGTTELHVARPYGETLYQRYILTYLKSPQFLVIGETRMTGTAGQKRVPKEFFTENPLPLPPLAEQHRIVNKVDELMALCDQLKDRLNQTQTLQQQLADAVVVNTVNFKLPTT